MMGQILSAAGKAGIRPDSGEIRLLRVLAWHRHFSAQAKAIFHQLTKGAPLSETDRQMRSKTGRGCVQGI